MCVFIYMYYVDMNFSQKECMQECMYVYLFIEVEKWQI